MQRQKVALAAEVKSVLDSWVRFEQQAKESEQADLVKSVVDSVLKSLGDAKVQKDVLTSAVAEIERESSSCHSYYLAAFLREDTSRNFASSRYTIQTKYSHVSDPTELVKNKAI